MGSPRQARALKCSGFQAEPWGPGKREAIHPHAACISKTGSDIDQIGHTN